MRCSSRRCPSRQDAHRHRSHPLFCGLQLRGCVQLTPYMTVSCTNPPELQPRPGRLRAATRVRGLYGRPRRSLVSPANGSLSNGCFGLRPTCGARDPAGARMRLKPTPNRTACRSVALGAVVALVAGVNVAPSSAQSVSCDVSALIAATEDANATAGADTISLAPNCVYSFTTPYTSALTPYASWYGP